MNSTNQSHVSHICNTISGCIYAKQSQRQQAPGQCLGCASLLSDQTNLCKTNQQCVYVSQAQAQA